MIQTLGIVSAVLMPFFDIPLVWRIVKRKSSDDISLVWTFGIWLCIMGMLPSSLVSPDPVLKAFGVVNLVLFTAVVAAVVWYHPAVQKKWIKQGIVLLGVLAAGGGILSAEEPNPEACLPEIERVCAGLENHLEQCLEERSRRLTPACRSVLESAADLLRDPAGPAACIPDVERLCPNLKSNALADCMKEKQPKFSDACQRYLQSAGQRD